MIGAVLVAPSTELEELERRFFQAHRRIVESMFDAAWAITRIRDERLWEGVAPSFSRYCETRLHITKGYASRLINSARIIDELRGAGHEHLPTTVLQCLQLLRAEKTQNLPVAEVWQQACEDHGTQSRGVRPVPSARQINQTVKRRTTSVHAAKSGCVIRRALAEFRERIWAAVKEGTD